MTAKQGLILVVFVAVIWAVCFIAGGAEVVEAERLPAYYVESNDTLGWEAHFRPVMELAPQKIERTQDTEDLGEKIDILHREVQELRREVLTLKHLILEKEREK